MALRDPVTTPMRARFQSPELRSVLIALLLFGFAFLKSLWGPILTNHGGDNLYAHQAASFLKRRLDISVSVPPYDSALFKGRIFVPFPPLPAVVMMPVVAAFGVERANGPLLASLLTLVDIIVAYRLLKRLGLTLADRVWLLLAFFLGTGYWYIVVSSARVWFWAQAVSITCLLLAVAEAWGRGRGRWVGLALAGAFLSRQMTILAGVGLAWRLWVHPAFTVKSKRWRNLIAFVICTGVGIVTYFLFNRARFGSILDTGYEYIQFGGFFHERYVRHGMFSAAYVPSNLLYLLVQGFHVDFNSPTRLSGVTPDLMGTSLLVGSPFVLLALLAGSAAESTLPALWTSIGAIAVSQLFYLNNGATQINTQRFTLDFMPLLLVLIAMGMRREAERGRARLWRGGICYAILLNALALVLLPALEPAFRLLEK